MAFDVVHANDTLLLFALTSTSPLHQAWQHTGEICRQTGLVIAHYSVAILLCAAVPAAERGYIHLRGPLMERRRIALLELLVTLWRVLLCAVAIWAACSGQQLRQLSARLGALAAWQIVLEDMGAHIAHHLRMILWELLFYALAMLLLHFILTLIARAVAARREWLPAGNRREALLSVLRNLILAPILVIWLVEIARPAFQ